MLKSLKLTLLLDLTPHQKNESSPFPSCLTLSLSWLQTTYWKKVSLTAFRQILSTNFSCGAHFQFIIMTYLKEFIGPFLQNSVQQNHLLELYPLYLPPHRKCFPFFNLACCPHHVWTAQPILPNLPLGENPYRWGKKPVQQQKNTHFQHQKNLLHQRAVFM